MIPLKTYCTARAARMMPRTRVMMATFPSPMRVMMRSLAWRMGQEMT